jgi:hypothetical protein
MNALTSACLLLLLATAAWPGDAPAPSANAGRRGTYQTDLKRHAQYKFWVCVPAAYGDEAPSGLHLFFHGQNGQTGAPNFGQWQGAFLEPFNLIGINMQYLDGDNGKDSDGKIEAAQDAIAQIMADYKVVLRGAVNSFSGGGIPHSGLHARVAASLPTQAWPFTHASLYGSNYRGSIGDGLGMSWFIGLGGGEWTLASLGATQSSRMGDLLGQALKRGSPDAYLRIEKEKGHSISNADVASAAAMFRRSDLAQGRFLHEPSWTGKAKPLAALANSLALGQAEGAIAKALKSETLPPDEREHIAKLKARVDARVDAVLALMQELSANDAALANWYGGIFTAQLKGHSRAKELKELLAGMAKDAAARKQLQAWEVFAKAYPSVIDGGGPKLKQPEKSVPLLEQILALAGERSLAGTMAREFLLLK